MTAMTHIIQGLCLHVGNFYPNPITKAKPNPNPKTNPNHP